MNGPLVTIAVTTYKSDLGYLREALQSAIGQTYPNLEILVGDNSPTDALGALCSSFADPRIVYRHRSPALSAGENHWQLFREARGKYVQLLSHDDVLEADCVERLVGHLERDGELALVFSDHATMDEASRVDEGEGDHVARHFGRSRLALGKVRPFLDLVLDQSVPLIATLFRRDLLPASFPSEIDMAYDQWLLFCLARTGLGAYYVPQRLVRWRIHTKSLTHTAGEASIAGTICAAKCWEFMARDAPAPEARRTCRRRASWTYASAAATARRCGRRAQSFRLGTEALRLYPSLRSVLATGLSVMPLMALDVHRRLARRHGSSPDAGSPHSASSSD